MAFYQLQETQELQASIEEVWAFISSPLNLKKITPPSMGFDITSDLPERMYEGMIISYKVSPLLGIKTNWVTEITHIREKEYFVDEQRVGPYSMWHHQHRIEPIKSGVLMKDIVTYQPPFGPVGALMNTLVISKKLREIFEFRRSALQDYFH